MVDYGEESSAESLHRLNRILCEQPGSSSEDSLKRVIGPNFLNLTTLNRASFRYGKRLVDIVFASAVLLVLSPVLLLCAIAIRAQSPGPILFRQRRLGKGGQ